MWKTLSLNRNLYLLKEARFVGRSCAFNLDKSLSIFSAKYEGTKPFLNQTRLSSTSPLPDMKTPLKTANTTSNANSDDKTKGPNGKNSQSYFLKLLAVFASGMVAYFGISFYLDNRSTNKTSGAINYSSNNLPGRVQPSKSVSF